MPETGMSTTIAIFVAVAAAGMLITYQMGFAAGRQEGFENGRKEGKKEGSVKAFAVGYDRGRHDRESKQSEDEDEEASGPLARLGCSVFLCLGFLPFCPMVLRVVVEKARLLGDFLSQSPHF